MINMDAKYEEKYHRIMAGLSHEDRAVLARNTHPITNSEIRAGIHKDNLLGPGDIEPFPSDPFIGEKWNLQKDLMNMPEELKGYNTKHRFETGILKSRVYYADPINPDGQNNPYIRSSNGDYLIDAGDKATMHTIRANGVGSNALKYGFKQDLKRAVANRNYQNVGRHVFDMQPAAYSMYGINKAKKAQLIVDPESIGFDPEDALRTHMQSAAEGRDQTIGHYEPSHQIFNAKRVNGLEAMLPRMAGQPRQQASIPLARDSDREGRLKRDVGAIGRSGNAAFFVPQSVVDAQEQDRKRRKSERQQVQAERQVPSVADLDAQFRREGKGYSASARTGGGWYLG